MNEAQQKIEAALEKLTAPGGEFPVGEAVIRGQTYKVFTTAPKNLLEYYQISKLFHPNVDFLVYEGERWTQTEVYAEAALLAHALRDRYGIEKGDRVAIAMRNYPEWIFAFMAVTGLGAVAVPMNAWWTEEELDYGLRDSGARLVIADRERARRIAASAKKHNAPIIGVRCGDDMPEGVTECRTLMRSVVAAEFPPVEVGPEDDATIFYTSGSTGFPKGVVSTHRGILSTVMSWIALTRARQMAEGTLGQPPKFPPSTLMTVPLFHVTGSHSLFLMSLIGGRKIVLMYKWDPQAALRLIEAEKVTNFTGVPTMSWELLHQPNLDSFNLESLQDIGAGGAARPAAHVKMLKDRFPNASPGSGYGLTETNALGAINVGDAYLERPGSTGRPTPPLVEMKIVDEDGTTLPAGKVGEILIRTAANFRCYWNKPEETAEALSPDGWFRSGDLGYLDEEGFLFIVDRAKDIVIRGGDNISCLEVEAVLYHHPDVFEASVFGLPDERLGETLNAVVVPKPGTAPSPDALAEYVGRHLASFKIPSRIWLQPEQLPRTASGKIYKREIRAKKMQELKLG
ncbi:MAG: acyl--CoA ligase [Alphaproteobacteria bacterium]|nr:acyl--CoA ligase [Alphaproteobacteria bacterium]